MNILRGIIGIFFFMFVAFICSKNKRDIDWKLVVWALIVQVLFSAMTLGPKNTSLVAMFLFVLTVAWYNLSFLFLNRYIKSNIVQLLISFILSSISIYLLQFLDTNIILFFTWFIFLVYGIFVTITAGKKLYIPKWNFVIGFILSTTIMAQLLQTGQTGSDFIQNMGNSLEKIISFGDIGGKFALEPFMDGPYIFAVRVGISVIYFTAFIGLIESLGLLFQGVLHTSKFVDWNLKMFKITPLSGAETLITVASIPLGGNNILLARSYLQKFTRSEILLTTGSVMATVSASLLGAYAAVGIPVAHLVAASVMSVPAVIILSKILIPETEKPLSRGKDIEIIKDKHYMHPLPAVMKGVQDGLSIALLISACVIAFISLIAFGDYIFLILDKNIDGELLKGSLLANGSYKGIIPSSIKELLGFIFSPVAWLMGTPLEDMQQMGYLMGAKIALNEFVAFAELGRFIVEGTLTPKGVIIASFALCGFANPGTVAIIMGYITPYVDGEQKNRFLKLGMISILVGAGASWMTATIAGAFLN